MEVGDGDDDEDWDEGDWYDSYEDINSDDDEYDDEQLQDDSDDEQPPPPPNPLQIKPVFVILRNVTFL